MKKVLSVILAVIIALSVSFSSYAEKRPTIVVEDVLVSDCNDIVVKISIENNPGLISMRMYLNYDKSILTLTGVSDGTVFGSGHSVFGDNLNASPYVMLWVDELAPKNYSDDGVLATLTFSTKAGADLSDTEISVELDKESVFDYDLNDYDFDVESGTVSFNGQPAGGDPVVFAESVVGEKGQTVNVPIVIRNNPGIIALMLSLTYDTSFMTLTGVTDKGLLGQGTSIFGNNYETVPYRMIWEDGLVTKNYSVDGELAVLTFRINPQTTATSGDVIIEVVNDSTFDIDLNDVNFTTEAGKVSLDGIPQIYLDGGVWADGQDIDVTLNIKANPGIISTIVNIDFDHSVLELISVENGEVFPYSCFMCGNDKTVIPYKLIWEDGLALSDNTANGILAILKFRVIDESKAEGTVINISYDPQSTFNAELDDISFETEGLTIKASLVLSSDSMVFVDYSKKFIVVESQYCNVEEAIYAASDDLDIRYIYNTDKVGTESKLTVVNMNGKTVEEYTFVFLGDLNCDGIVNGMDAVIDNCIISAMLSKTDVSKAVWMAADFNSDGTVNSSDSEEIQREGLNIQMLY